MPELTDAPADSPTAEARGMTPEAAAAEGAAPDAAEGAAPDAAEGAAPDAAEALRIAFVPGVMPEKWFRRYRERTMLPLTGFSDDEPLTALADGRARMALVRGEPDGDALHRVRLYDETPGVAVEKEHVLSVTKDTDVAAREDLADDLVLLESDDPAAVRGMLQVVATGAGIVLAPRPLLRALNARGVMHRDVEMAPDSEPTTIWLTWPKELDDDVTQEFVGIVRGRRAGSRRSVLGAESGPAAVEERPKLSARQKALAKQERRAAAQGRAGGSGGKGGGGAAKGTGGRGGRGAGTSRGRKRGGSGRGGSRRRR